MRNVRNPNMIATSMNTSPNKMRVRRLMSLININFKKLARDQPLFEIMLESGLN